MTRIVWITGRAASGKSTIVAEVELRLRQRGLAVLRLCDEDLLFQLKAADRDHQHHWHPNGDPNQFHLRSGHLFDEGIRVINARLNNLLHSTGNQLALVELARGRGEPIDVSYRRALELVDPHIWAHSSVFRIDVPYATQRTRNQQRAEMGGRATPDSVLDDLYGDDDPQPFTQAGISIISMDGRLDPHLNAVSVVTSLDIGDPPAQHVVGWARRSH